MGKHYVPRRYLQGFATPGSESLVFQYDKKQRRWSSAAITKVAQQPDYFDPVVETSLAREVERPAHLVLDRLGVTPELNDADREALTLYIAVMLMRVPRKRRRGLDAAPELLEDTINRFRAELQSVGENVEPSSVAAFEAELDRVHQSYRRVLPDQVLDQIKSPWPTPVILELVSRMAWRLVPAPGNAFFITSDNPAFYFDCYGLGTPRAELTFPINSRLALVGSHQGPAGSTIVARPRMEVVAEVNRRIAYGADRFVFAPLREGWITAMSDKAAPRLTHIHW